VKRKSALWLLLLRFYVRRRMRSAFSDVLVRKLHELRAELEIGPLILAANHVAWWDPLALVLLDAALGSDGYGLMDQESLHEVPVFARVGALPLSRTRPKLALQQLREAAQILNRPRRFLAIFPSGKQSPAHLPLPFERGVLWLAQKSGAKVVPIAFRYEFGESPRPVLFVSIGSSFRPGGSSADLASLEDKVQTELGQIDAQLRRWTEAPHEPVNPTFTSLLHAQPKLARSGRIPPISRLFRAPKAHAPSRKSL
jgi:1-acyl-sn-glycerol-3-phosphate acyltransferase